MTTQPKTIYQRLIEAGFEVSNHESDLYFPINPETTAMVNELFPVSGGRSNCVSKFTSNIDGKRMYEVAFAYDPWWEKAEKEVEKWTKNSTPEI